MSVLLINGVAANISEKQFASFHGESVFTTLRSHNGTPLLWRLHWQRLARHAEFFGYPLPSETEILARLAPHLHDSDKKIRIIAARKHDAITIEPFASPSSTIYGGVHVVLSSWQTHNVLGRMKTGNSLPYFMAQREASKVGAFEALLTNQDGFVVDGARTSLLHFDGTTLTALDGGLDGCMRAFVMRALSRRGISVVTRYMKPEELTGQLFIMNSLMGVVPALPITSSKFVEDVVTLFRMDGILHAIYDDMDLA